MSESDVLLTIAEVAVAFAGFASLVGLLGKGSSADDPRVLGFRMRAMLLTSLLVVAFSLFPILFDRYGASQRWVWTASSLALLVVSLRYAYWFWESLVALGRAEVLSTKFQRRVIIPTLLSALVGLGVLLVVNVIIAAPAVYLTALAVLLFQSGFAFCLIVFSFLPRISDADVGAEQEPGES